MYETLIWYLQHFDRDRIKFLKITYRQKTNQNRTMKKANNDLVWSIE